MCVAFLVSPLSVCTVTFCVLFPCLSFLGLYLSRLLPGSRSFLLIQPTLLHILMPVEPRFLAAKAKSISLSAWCLCSNILPATPAKIFMLYSWEMLREHIGTGKDTAGGLLGSYRGHSEAHITVAHEWCFFAKLNRSCRASAISLAQFFSVSAQVWWGIWITLIEVTAE